MDVFSQALLNLLAQQQRIVLPGLGTLYTEQSKDPSLADQIPVPRKRVVYTTVEEDEGMFLEIVAVLSGVAVKDLKPQYNRWVASIRKASKDRDLEIEGVVTLQCQADGTYLAVPSAELEHYLNPLKEHAVRVPFLPSEKDIPAPTPQKRSGRKRWVWPVLVSVVLLMAGGYYIYTTGCLDRSSSPSKPYVPLGPDEIQTVVVGVPESLPADSVRFGNGIPDVDSGELTSSVSAGSLPENHAGEVYHLIAGVFSNRDNAERYVNEKQFEASVTTIIPTSNGKFMVSVGRYADKGTADREMARLQKTIPQAWVSKRSK